MANSSSWRKNGRFLANIVRVEPIVFASAIERIVGVATRVSTHVALLNIIIFLRLVTSCIFTTDDEIHAGYEEVFTGTSESGENSETSVDIAFRYERVLHFVFAR